jgi:hypothetical protein
VLDLCFMNPSSGGSENICLSNISTQYILAQIGGVV